MRLFGWFVCELAHYNIQTCRWLTSGASQAAATDLSCWPALFPTKDFRNTLSCVGQPQIVPTTTDESDVLDVTDARIAATTTTITMPTTGCLTG